MVVAVLMIAVVLVSLYIVMQRRRNARKPELPSRQAEAQEAPPRPPPRAKLPYASSILDYVSHDENIGSEMQDEQQKEDSFWKTRILNREWERESSPKRDLSHDQSLYGQAGPDEEKGSVEVHHDDHAEEVQNTTSGDQNVKEEETRDAKQDIPEEKPAEVKETKGRPYAAVDYEKKRESRLLKGQRSEEGTKDREEKETEKAEKNDDDSSSPALPPKQADIEPTKATTGRRRGRRDEDQAMESKQEPEATIKKEEESQAVTGRRRGKAAAEAETPAEDTKTEQPRRTRVRAEATEEQEEPKGLRGARRTREK